MSLSGSEEVSDSAMNFEAEDVEIKIECQEEFDPDEEEYEDEAITTPDNGPDQFIYPTVLLNGMGTYNLWTSKATACLINQYKKFRSMVGQTNQFRSLRDMFDTISIEMRKLGYFFSSQKCENKWRVLERKYKNLVLREAMKKPGRVKHYGHWEHRKALDEIFNETKKNVYLEESDYPTGTNSTKYALILPRPPITEEDPIDTVGTVQKPTKTYEKSNNVQKNQDSASEMVLKLKSIEELMKVAVNGHMENFMSQMKQQFEESEKSKEKRHQEKMLLLQEQLNIQRQILKVKEQKLELEKKKIMSMAKSLM